MIVYFAWDGFGKVIHQSISPAPSPSPPTTALSVLGVGHLQIFHCPGAGHLPTPGAIPELSNTHAVSHLNKTTQRVLLEKKQIGLSVKDRNKLKRVVRACSRFYACISSLLIKPKLHSETGAIDVNQRYQYQYQYYLKNILS